MYGLAMTQSDKEAERAACTRARNLLRALADNLKDNDSSTPRSRVEAVTAAICSEASITPAQKNFVDGLLAVASREPI